MNFFDRWFKRDLQSSRDYLRIADLNTRILKELEHTQNILRICSREEFARREQVQQLREELAKVASQRDDLARAAEEAYDREMNG